MKNLRCVFSCCDHLHLTDDLLHSIRSLLLDQWFYIKKLFNSCKLKTACTRVFWPLFNMFWKMLDLIFCHTSEHLNCLRFKFIKGWIKKRATLKQITYQLILIGGDCSKYRLRENVRSIFFSFDICYRSIRTIRAED